MPLQDVLTLKSVRALADERSFARGMAYFHDGVVGMLHEKDDVLRADVMGSYLYQVTLSESLDGDLEHDCTCPVGQDGDFCKHAVAVALSWLENQGEETFPPDEDASGRHAAKPRKKRKTQADTLAEYLDTLSEAALKEWLMEAAARDRGLRDKLLLKARASGTGGKSASGLAALRKAVLKAARQSAFLDWHQAGDFAERLHDAAQLIEERIALGEPGLIAIIEETVQQADASLENVDDSDGAAQEALHRLGAAHLNACLASRPDPVELAGRLFDTELNADLNFYPATLPHYAKVLGGAGLARYRELMQEAASKLAPKHSKDRIATARLGASSYTLEGMVRRLCEFDGDDTLLLRVLENDLSSGYAYLKIAEQHLKAGREPQALDWAERGLAAFSDERDSRLTDFAIALHRKQKNDARADALAWTQFTRRPHFEGWRHLLEHTPKARREEITQRAIALLEQRMVEEESAPKPAKRRPLWDQPSTRSELIRVHLHLKQADAVWQLAKGHAIDARLWPKVAAMRGQTHPDDAIAIYKKLLPGAIRQGQGKARYDEAHELVGHIRALRIGQDRKEEYRQELAALRVEYKAKRNFIKRLDSLEP